MNFHRCMYPCRFNETYGKSPRGCRILVLRHMVQGVPIPEAVKWADLTHLGTFLIGDYIRLVCIHWSLAPLLDRKGRTSPSDIPPTTDMRDFARNRTQNGRHYLPRANPLGLIFATTMTAHISSHYGLTRVHPRMLEQHIVMLQCIIWYDTMNVNSVSYHMGSPNALNQWII